MYYSHFVKFSSETYRLITKATATLLFMAFLLPSGLHAKQLVDFCKMELAGSVTIEMTEDHSCCESEAEEEKTESHQHHDCDWGFICACSIGQSQLGDEDWVPTHKDTEVVLTETGSITPFYTNTEEFPAYNQPRIGEYNPPLWLLYDTFLM